LPGGARNVTCDPWLPDLLRAFRTGLDILTTRRWCQLRCAAMDALVTERGMARGLLRHPRAPVWACAKESLAGARLIDERFAAFRTGGK